MDKERVHPLRRRLVFRPISTLYYALLLFLLITLLPYIALFFRDLLVGALGLPPETVGSFLFLSLIGSFFNIPSQRSGAAPRSTS